MHNLSISQEFKFRDDEIFELGNKMISKKNLRKKAKEIRASLDMNTLSEKIIENILKFEPYKKAKNVMIFYPLDNEISLLPLLDDTSKKFYLPKVNGNELLVCPYKIGDKLTISRFKSLESMKRPINSEILDVIFVPALMADKYLNRLGYGGGFYDRFLSKNGKHATKIIAIANELIIDKIPSNDFDEKANYIINEISIFP